MKLGRMVALVPTAFLAATVTFEAASVKPASPPVSTQVGGMSGGPGTGDPGRVTFPRATLSDLLARAYDVRIDQISGPAWLNDLSAFAYRIDATMPPQTTEEQFRLMLQDLLAERFHVRLHHETRTRPGYEQVVASGGPKLKRWIPSLDAPTEKPSVDQGFAIPRGGRAGPIRMSNRETVAMSARALDR